MVLHSWDGTDIAISNETPSQQVVFVKAAHLEKEHILYITFIQETTLMYMSTYVYNYIYIYIWKIIASYNIIDMSLMAQRAPHSNYVRCKQVVDYHHTIRC